MFLGGLGAFARNVPLLTFAIQPPYPVLRVKQKTGPDESAAYDACCVSYNLRKSSQVVSRIYAREMHDAPVRGPSSITALAKEVGFDRTTLTRNLKPLEQRGLVHIELVTANRKEVSLLPAGEVALRRAIQFWRKAQTKVVTELGEDRWNRMRGDLAAVIALGQ